MNAKEWRNSSGISLLEVLVAMIILSLGLLGLAPLFVNSIKGNVNSRDNTVAAGLASERIEQYEKMSPLPALPFYSTEPSLGGGAYTRTTSILDHATDSLVPAGGCRIDVTVAWRDDHNIDRTSHLSTIIVNP